jgi:hypothetical protein
MTSLRLPVGSLDDDADTVLRNIRGHLTGEDAVVARQFVISASMCGCHDARRLLWLAQDLGPHRGAVVAELARRAGL